MFAEAGWKFCITRYKLLLVITAVICLLRSLECRNEAGRSQLWPIHLGEDRDQGG